MIDKVAKFVGAFTIYLLFLLVLITVLGLLIKGSWVVWSGIF